LHVDVAILTVWFRLFDK